MPKTPQGLTLRKNEGWERGWGYTPGVGFSVDKWPLQLGGVKLRSQGTFTSPFRLLTMGAVGQHGWIQSLSAQERRAYSRAPPFGAGAMGAELLALGVELWGRSYFYFAWANNSENKKPRREKAGLFKRKRKRHKAALWTRSKEIPAVSTSRAKFNEPFTVPVAGQVCMQYYHIYYLLTLIICRCQWSVTTIIVVDEGTESMMSSPS